MNVFLSFLVSLLIWGCTTAPRSDLPQPIEVPSEQILQAIIDDAISPRRPWGEFPGKPKRVVFANRVYSEDGERYVKLTDGLSRRWLSQVQLVEDTFEYLGPDMSPDTLDEIVLSLRSTSIPKNGRKEVLVAWAFSRRICGSDWLTLENGPEGWTVTGSRVNSIC